MTRLLPASLAAAAWLLTSTASAQYSGPGAQAPVQSVAAALAAADDSAVDLSGTIVKQLTDEKYLFTDGKGQIRIEIDRELFANRAINEKTRVRIYGEVEKDFLESPEIDVKRLELL